MPKTFKSSSTFDKVFMIFGIVEYVLFISGAIAIFTIGFINDI